MAERYKQIKFNKLDLASDIPILDIEKPEVFNTSLGLEPDIKTGRLKLAGAFTLFTLDIQARAYAYYRKSSCLHAVSSSNRIYHILYHPVNTRTELWVHSGYAVPSYLHNFGNTSTDGYMVASYKGKVLVWYKDGTTKQDYSVDDGATFTNQDWTYSIPYDYIIAEDQTIYVRTQDEIIKSVDGINWTLVYDAGLIDARVGDIAELDGELYAIIHDTGNSINLFCKINIDDEPIIIRDFQGNQISTKMKQFDNRIIIADYATTGQIIFYEWTKSDLVKIATLSATVSVMAFLAADDQYLYFSINKDTIIKININNAVFVLGTYTPEANATITTGLKYKGNFCFFMTAVNGPTYYSYMHRGDASETKMLTGNFTTSRIDVGRHIPAYIIAKHDQLGDNASIIIKAKIDDAPTFATTILTNATNDSVRKQVSLKSLTDQCDFIEFEITLADSGGTGDINKLELIYFYIPNGIENSK